VDKPELEQQTRHLTPVSVEVIAGYRYLEHDTPRKAPTFTHMDVLKLNGLIGPMQLPVKRMTNRGRIPRFAFTTAAYGASLIFAVASPIFAQVPASLYEGFRNPSMKYRPTPISYWNPAIDVAEIKRQIDDHPEHGAQGATIYSVIGLRTRYLSQEWCRV
jgi:hypothetical protein